MRRGSAVEFAARAGIAVAFVACGGARPEPATHAAMAVEDIAAELDALSRGLTLAHRDTFRSILEETLASDAYRCFPSPREIFFGDVPEGGRQIEGIMPHYGVFFGPMRYFVERRREGWRVEVVIALEPPGEGELELPDCALRAELTGDVRCEGTPYAQASGTDACPASGTFRAPASAHNVRALLGRWSRDAERYYVRDAELFGLPIVYDFEFVLAEEAGARAPRVDASVPLRASCGRTPYFSSFRSGWSLPIVAHEVGHFLGLLDEYEAFSGIVRAYPKTPFPGAEVSRMGLSMKEATRVLPLHHYLVLRRALCPEPKERDPFRTILR